MHTTAILSIEQDRMVPRDHQARAARTELMVHQAHEAPTASQDLWAQQVLSLSST